MAWRAHGGRADRRRGVTRSCERTGEFECSDELLNQLQRNVVRGHPSGTSYDVPTDCPQRDERLGWTGDIAVFAPTAACLFDVDGFPPGLARRTSPPSSGQPTGRVPLVVPDVSEVPRRAVPSTGRLPESAAIWSDAAVWVPWALWRAYGDRQVLS